MNQSAEAQPGFVLCRFFPDKQGARRFLCRMGFRRASVLARRPSASVSAGKCPGPAIRKKKRERPATSRNKPKDRASSKGSDSPPERCCALSHWLPKMKAAKEDVLFLYPLGRTESSDWMPVLRSDYG
jgi:hypothetical protein